MRHRSPEGSVVLVALSCVTVLGIAMVSFLAVSNQAMKLSHRTYAKAVSKQLAEMGLERALRSFNANSFGSWTRPDATTATLTLTIPSSRYGNSGITAAVKIRVDHYRDTRKTTPWSVLTTYAVNDFVWYQGVWYLCTSAPPLNQAPSDTAYWKSAPALWSPFANYRIGNIVLSGGIAYRCLADHINQNPPNAYWTGASVATWDAITSFNANDVVVFGGTRYRCISAHTNQLPPNTAYWLSAPVIYAEGVATLPDRGSTTLKTQLQAFFAPAALFPNAAGATTLTNLSSTLDGVVDSYNSVLGASPPPGTAGTWDQQTAPFSAASPNIGSSAVLAGGNTTGTAVAISNTRVRGYVAAPSTTTSPFAPLWSSGTAGIVTDKAKAVTPIPATKIDLTRVSRSPYIPQFDIQPVSADKWNLINVLSSPSELSGTNDLPRGSDLPSSDGKYYYYTNGSLYLDNNDTLNIKASVVIDIRPTSNADLYIQGSGKIVIANNPTACLEIHFGDELFVGSNSGGGIDNLTKDPKRCLLLGTSTYNSSSYHYYWSNLPYYGVIYMPNAYLHLWNSGYNEPIFGALSARNIYFNHSVNLHYDTSLRTAVISGVDAPYEISEWRELSDASERVTLP